METIVIGLVGATAVAYLIRRGIKSWGKSSECPSGGCAGCAGCACGTGARGNKAQQ